MPKLSIRLTQIAVAASLAVGAFTLPAAANFVGVSRCNSPGGSSEPVLHFVSGGQRFTIAVGQGGLTSAMIMNQRRALAWAAASDLFPEGTVFGNYAGYICGLPSPNDVAEPEPEPPVVSREIEEPFCDLCE